MKSAQFLLAIGLKATNPLIVITKKYPTRHVISLFASSRWGAVVILTTSVMIGLRRVGRLALFSCDNMVGSGTRGCAAAIRAPRDGAKRRRRMP